MQFFSSTVGARRLHYFVISVPGLLYHSFLNRSAHYPKTSPLEWTIRFPIWAHFP